jgi:hypothetical protein
VQDEGRKQAQRERETQLGRQAGRPWGRREFAQSASGSRSGTTLRS